MISMLLLWALAAQTDHTRLTFDVASVKPAGEYVPGQPFQRGGPGSSDPGRVTFPRVTISDLIRSAYDVWSDQIVGPDWISEPGMHAYAVTATMPSTTTPEQFRGMLQNLLADRFHVRLHHETLAVPGYELVIAEGGHKLREWKPAAGGRNGPTVSFNIPASSGPAPIRMQYRTTMAMFTRGLGANINYSNGIPGSGPRPRVIDKTGLAGTYEFTLEYAGVMLTPAALAMSGHAPDGAPTASDPSGAPNIFTAVEKQLGLKLRKVKDVAVDVLVIDAADKTPTEN